MTLVFWQRKLSGRDGVRQVVDGHVRHVGERAVQLGLDAAEAVVVVNVQIFFVFLLSKNKLVKNCLPTSELVTFGESKTMKLI